MLEKWKNLEQKKKIMAIVAAVVLIVVVVAVGIAVAGKSKSNVKHVSSKKTETCPIDFDEWKQQNEEVYAYIEVPDTDISYPVLQREGDAEYYANHQIDGTEGLPGVIYTEPINSQDFSDNNTILYGHNMKNGTMFHTLHKFEDEKFFKKDREFYVYTPEHRFTYKIFAAACIDDEHLMVKYNFSTKEGNMNFITDLQKIENSYSHYKEGTEITGDTKLCTLFTCMPAGMENNRYIVVGYLTDTLDYEKK